jgi:hypothetical protein
VAKRFQFLVPIVLVAYFSYFASGAIRAHFAGDDPVNLGYYWPRGFGRVLLDNLCFWSTAYRPMGGVFYLSIYHFFHLNPLPYRLAILAILAANIGLTWSIAFEVSRSKAAGAIAAALVCGHAAMVTIYYNTSMIYDILAYFFTALMLVVYLRVRSGDVNLTRWQMAAVILGYVAALNSKEIAVVAAGWVLAYEILIARPRQWITPVVLIAIGSIYTAGKMYGPESLSKKSGYQLDLTLHRYLSNNELYLNSLFYSQYFHSSPRLLIAWGILTLVCMLLRKRELWWCWFLVSTATLGTSFTVNPRDGGSLYIPLLAWALLVAVMVSALLRRPALQWAAAAVIVILWSRETIHWWRDAAPPYLENQRLTWSAITQIGELPRPKPGSRVMILNSPFQGWHALLISELVWNDHSIQIEMGDKSAAPPTEAELKSYDWILGFERDAVQVLRKPDSTQGNAWPP